ncbi:MAG: methyltransferase [Symploca sp. SIO1B1]|nr:methyltransferase [Symploca sp. SIO1C2]NER92515.1 methyltransferase [Symploca sp. SIO1B1]
MTNQATLCTDVKYFFDPFVIKIEMDGNGDVWKPTPHGMALAQGMAKVPHVFCGKTVIEIGAGTGIHAILAMKLGAQSIDITDINEMVITTANKNADKNNVEFRQTWVRDWMNFEPSEPYDVVLCNPPFCKAGTPNRRWFITELMEQSSRFLKSGGYVIFCQSSMANFPFTEKELKGNNFMYEIVHKTRELFRDYYFTEPGFIEESRQVPNGFELIDDEYIETLQVYLGTLKF